MSVSDPLLKKLKVHLYQLRTDPDPIGDHHKSLKPFCEILEAILRKGLKQSNSIFGLSRRDYWNWVETIAKDNYGNGGHPYFIMAVDYARKCNQLFNCQGRGRLFLRAALQKKALSHAINQLVHYFRGVEFWYDPDRSILADDILREIFLSLLYEVNGINFHLDLRNCSFLDQTWALPVYMEHEFVPTKDLGIEIQHCETRVLVSGLDPRGVAYDVGKIEVGDVLDTVLGEALRYIPKGKIQSLLRQNQGFPVRVGFSKCKLPDGSIFPPIAELLQIAGRDASSLLNILDKDKQDQQDGEQRKPPHALLPEEEWDEIPVHSADDKAEYDIKFLGTVELGPRGGIDQIEGAIGKILAELNPDKHPEMLRDVIFELGETDVIVTDAKTKQLIYQHSYTGISSCGRRIDMMKYIAYLAGETTCSLSKQFVAYVFKANTEFETWHMSVPSSQLNPVIETRDIAKLAVERSTTQPVTGQKQYYAALLKDSVGLTGLSDVPHSFQSLRSLTFLCSFNEIGQDTAVLYTQSTCVRCYLSTHGYKQHHLHTTNV